MPKKKKNLPTVTKAKIVEKTSILREEMAIICRKIYEKGLTYSTGGNISAKIADDIFLIKPADFCFGDMQAEDFLVVNGESRILEGPKGNRPSSESPFHLAIYKAFPKEINAVIHAHSPYTLVFATMGEDIDPLTTFAEEEIGRVPLAPRRKPGTQELADILVQTLRSVENQLHAPLNQPAIACLAEAHGVVIAGKELKKTFFALESLETTARTILWMRAVQK